MKKVILTGVAAVALLAGSGYGWYWWTTGRFIQSTDDAYIRSDVTIVAPQIEGRVRTVPVTDNQLVHKGDTLAVIDDADYRSKLDQASATVTAKDAAIGSIDAQLVLEQARISAAAAAVVSAQAERERLRKDLDRYAALLKNDFVSRQNYDATQSSLRKAEAAVDQAQAQLAAEKQQVGVLQASRKEAEAALLQARAALDAARLNLGYTVVQAPIDGVVGAKGVQIGQYVKAGTQLMSLVPLPDVYVVANFKETQLQRMRIGQPVEVTIDAFPDRPITGRVESVSPGSGSQFSLLPPDNATGNFTKIVQRVPVRIAVPQDSALAGLLRPGLSVTAAVDTKAPSDGATLAGGVFGAAIAATPEKAAEKAAASDPAAAELARSAR